MWLVVCGCRGGDARTRLTDFTASPDPTRPTGWLMGTGRILSRYLGTAVQGINTMALPLSSSVIGGPPWSGAALMFSPIDTFWKPCSGWPAALPNPERWATRPPHFEGGRPQRPGMRWERTASYAWVHGLGGWDGMRWMAFLGHVRGEKRLNGLVSLNAHASANANANVTVKRVWVS